MGAMCLMNRLRTGVRFVKYNRIFIVGTIRKGGRLGILFF